MAKHGLEVAVTKTVSSVVYMVVDDADPRFAEWFVDGKIVPAMQALSQAAEREAREIDPLEWDDHDAGYDVVGVKRFPSEKVEGYPHLDLNTLPDAEVAEATALVRKEREWYKLAVAARAATGQ